VFLASFAIAVLRSEAGLVEAPRDGPRAGATI
jgi:hypothetical protein